jgi:energy-coupling factor transporter ATP-binding protein EcfA2
MTRDKLQIESSPNGEKKRLSRPAYFLSLEVENVKSFGPRQFLDLSNGQGRPAQWTIILGDNGVGKTTLLQGLAAIVPRVRSGVRLWAGVDFMQKFRWGLYRSGIQDTTSILSAEFYKGIKLSDKKDGDRVSGIGFKSWGALNPVLGIRDCFFILDNDQYEKVDAVTCFGYGASRRMGQTSLSERVDDEPFASLFSDDVALLNAEEWLLQADYAAHAARPEAAKKRAEKRRDEIREVLINLLPDVEDIRFAQLTEKQQKPGVEVKTPYGWVSIKDLSLGYKTLIAWMVDFASRMFDRYPESRNPLAEAAVVLVDEIDLHLHPKWQRTLMGYLSERFPNTQFIATAHSPLVVQAASDANIVLLRRIGDHVVIENDVKAIHGWRVDQILTSDLFGLESARPPQLDVLLEERTKLLAKSRLTKKDRARLKELEEEIGALPTGETPEDMEAMDIIRRAAERLKKEGRETSHDSGD